MFFPSSLASMTGLTRELSVILGGRFSFCARSEILTLPTTSFHLVDVSLLRVPLSHVFAHFYYFEFPSPYRQVLVPSALFQALLLFACPDQPAPSPELSAIISILS